MRVVDVPLTDGGYTAFIPEGILDRWALRCIPGLERVYIGVIVMRDAIGGGDGTTLVRRWPERRKA